MLSTSHVVSDVCQFLEVTSIPRRGIGGVPVSRDAFLDWTDAIQDALARRGRASNHRSAQLKVISSSLGCLPPVIWRFDICRSFHTRPRDFLATVVEGELRNSLLADYDPSSQVHKRVIAQSA